VPAAISIVSPDTAAAIAATGLVKLHDPSGQTVMMSALAAKAMPLARAEPSTVLSERRNVRAGMLVMARWLRMCECKVTP
jgi:hypothetical protein